MLLPCLCPGLGGAMDSPSPDSESPLDLYSGQVRWRFGHELYALAEGGTLLFPEADGALRPGAFASLGLGVDNAR
ncbi:hypothetical protein Q664_46195 [Archangium violaceum Cb vi76]|uniref:Uncharacterized protein n=1 Tax=Archangium violaceum Cb vi76 TaxID=1406225 RepID=A0A084SGU7_9BACT|nr:hypothetical protein Q664_46195 [Archangium violaceum Cb vi76]